MKLVSTVRELREVLTSGGDCKIELPEDERLIQAVEQAGLMAEVAQRGVLLIPRGVTRVLLACVASLGAVVAEAVFDEYQIGLKRRPAAPGKPAGWCLYLQKSAGRASVPDELLPISAPRHR